MAAPKHHNVALIMAGGSGTRFWPLSTKSFPKQYVNLLGKQSLIQDTVKRISPVFEINDTFIVSTAAQKSILKKQIPKIKNLILEPEGKNTAPCLMLAARNLLQKGYPGNTVIGVFPADHTVKEPKTFEKIVSEAIHFASETSGIVTLGIEPEFPHTGYGYIQMKEPAPGWKNVFHVSKFKEKPDLKTAEEYLTSGKYYWNAGIFIFRLDTIISAFQEFLGKEWNNLLQAKTEAAIKKAYKTLTPTPIDIAVLEKSPFVYLIPCKMGWSDIGSWSALCDLKAQGKKDNLSNQKNSLFVKSQNNYIQTTTTKNIALIGCDNLVVIETKDSLLICNKDSDQLVREASKKFDK